MWWGFPWSTVRVVSALSKTLQARLRPGVAHPAGGNLGRGRLSFGIAAGGGGELPAHHGQRRHVLVRKLQPFAPGQQLEDLVNCSERTWPLRKP
jgi:hypothetical protein